MKKICTALKKVCCRLTKKVQPKEFSFDRARGKSELSPCKSDGDYTATDSDRAAQSGETFPFF